MSLIIDIGCGKNKFVGSIGIDISKKSDADIIADLKSSNIPLKSNNADIIICQDVLEHITDIENFFSEIIRISKSSAIVKIRTPHYTSRYAYNDYTHHHFWGFDFLLKLKERFENSDIKINIKEKKLILPKIWRLVGIETLMNAYSHRYEQLFCYIFPAENMYFEIEIIKYNN